MKYKVTVPIYDEQTIEVNVYCRSDAQLKTLFRKVASTIHPLVKDIIPVKSYQYTKGSIWTNGGFNEMWINCNSCNPIVDVFVERADGMKVFI